MGSSLSNHFSEFSASKIFNRRKLIAVVRGIQPAEAEEAALSIFESGFDWLEVTTNSKDYLRSVAIMIKAVPEAKVGVGTVLTEEQVVLAREVGAKFIVSPNCNPSVIRKTKQLGLVSVPGILTPTEAFTALECGADILKLFPVGWINRNAIKDLRAVLPSNTLVFAVGGVNRNNYQDYLGVGYDGLGIGSELYHEGKSMTDLRKDAKAVVSSYDQARQMLDQSN